LLCGFAAAAAAPALLFGWLAFTESRYPYNELGRYFDGSSVHLEQDVEVYAFFAVLSGLVAVLMFLVVRARKVERARAEETR
jgi:hypothetical protein